MITVTSLDELKQICRTVQPGTVIRIVLEVVKDGRTDESGPVHTAAGGSPAEVERK